MWLEGRGMVAKFVADEEDSSDLYVDYLFSCASWIYKSPVSEYFYFVPIILVTTLYVLYIRDDSEYILAK